MMSSSSNLVNNLAKGIHKIKFNNCNCFLEYESVNNDLVKYKGLSCNKNYSNKINEELKKSGIHLSFLIVTLIDLFCC